MIIEGFAAKLKGERERRGMSREEVARKASISQGTLQKIEDGVVKNPSITTVMNILNSIGVKGEGLEEVLGVGDVIKPDESFTKEFTKKIVSGYGSKK